jgi:hypothetical protein
MNIELHNLLTLAAIFFLCGLTIGLCICIAITRNRTVALATVGALALTVSITMISQRSAFSTTDSQVRPAIKMLASAKPL